MARTHFTVKTQVREGRSLKFVADYHDGSAVGPIVGSQTFICEAAATRADQEKLMAAAVRREIVAEDAAIAAPLLVPANTTIALTAADTLTVNETLVKDLQQKLRRHRLAQKAVVEGALTAADNQVVTRKNEFVAAFGALVTATNLNTALDIL